MSQGVIFIATGSAYVQAACWAAASVRACCPQLAVDLFCDQPPDAQMLAAAGLAAGFDQIHVIASPHRRSKVDCMGQSRFEQTLYLDTDVMVVADISHLFSLLERFDIAMCHAHLRNTTQAPSPWSTSIPFAFPQLNSGVVLYSKRATDAGFFDLWQQAFHKAGEQKDQVTLRYLLWQTDLRVYVLPPEYNIRYLKTLRSWRPIEAHPAILHMAVFQKRNGKSWLARLKTALRIRRLLAALAPWRAAKAPPPRP